MTLRADRPAPLKKAEIVYRFLVIAVGGILLVWATLLTPRQDLHLGPGLVIALFIAFQVNFPLRLLRTEISIIQAVTLTGGLLYGLATVGWAVAAGVFLGYWVRSRLRDDPLMPLPAATAHWAEASYITGMHVIALALALSTSQYLFGAATILPNAVENLAWLRLLPPMLLFVLGHAILFLIDCNLRFPPASSTPTRDLYSLALVELLPLPFVLLAVLAYPDVRAASLVAAGGVPVILAIFIYGMSSARSALERRVQELSTLNQISQVLRTSLDLDNLLSIIQRQMSQMLAVDNFFVALYDDASQTIWYPLAVKHGQRQDWQPRALEDRLTDRVIRDGTPILISQQANGETSLVDLPPSEESPTAWLGVPLISSERVLGCLALFSVQPRAEFTQSDLDLMTILSGQTSVAIENALLYEQAQRRAAQLENLNQISRLISASLDPQEVLAQVCRSVSQVGGGKGSAIFLMEPEESRVWLAHAHELSETFVSHNETFSLAHDGRTRCLRTGRPALTLDITDLTLEREFRMSLREERICAYGDFPLVTPEGQIGFLSVYYDAPHVFSADEVELLQTFASEAALAVSNARMHARTDLALSQRANQLTILEAVGRELAAATHSDRLFEMILNYAREFTNSPWGGLDLYNPETRLMEVKASAGYPEWMSVYPLNKGISGRAVRTKQAIIVGDVSQDEDYVDLTNGEAHSQISIPLIHQGQVLGVLTLESALANAYSAGDQAFLTQLVNQAAIAVVNANLYTETQRRLREQSTLYQVSKRLGTRMDLESVLETVEQAISATLEYAVVGIYLLDEIEQVYRLQWGGVPKSGRAAASAQAGKPGSGMEQPGRLPEAIPESEVDRLFGQAPEASLVQFREGEKPPAALVAGCQGCEVLFLPLVANQQRLGAALLHLPEGRRLQDDESQLLQAITAQGAISLQNALLFADVMRGRERMAAVLNSVREGILMVEAGGRIILVNETIEEITGLPESMLVGKRVNGLVEGALKALGYTRQEALDLVDALSRGQMAEAPRLTFKLEKAQPERFLERSSLPVWGSGGGAIGWMVVLRDVTEEQQIAQARELITETLVHDLRSPVGAMLGALDILEEDLSQREEPGQMGKQALQVARRAGKRVLGMIESMLDISRMQSGSMDMTFSTVDMRALIAGTLDDHQALAKECGLSLRGEAPEELPPVYADLSKVSRVLVNLVDNAIKFTPVGGEVTVGARRTPEGMVEVCVSDTGPGIPEEYREKIFERFTQVPGQRGRRRGSGLGLTFCRLATQAHGGRIWVEPGEGGGSLFTFTLPVASEK